MISQCGTCKWDSNFFKVLFSLMEQYGVLCFSFNFNLSQYMQVHCCNVVQP